MAISTSLRNKIAAALTAGALATAGVMIKGTNGNDGLEGVSYTVYKDVVGVPTVCYGHTGSDIVYGKTYTREECAALLQQDLKKIAAQIDPAIKHPIPDATRAAIYSFTYNVGAGAFKSSTLLKKINAGDTVGACEELRRWAYAGGKKWKGLVNRREIEREVCLWGKNA